MQNKTWEFLLCQTQKKFKMLFKIKLGNLLDPKPISSLLGLNGFIE